MTTTDFDTRRFITDRLNDCEDIKAALRRSGPGTEDALDNLIDAFNHQIRIAFIDHGLDLGFHVIDIDDDRRKIVPPLAQVIKKLEAALERPE